LHDGDIIAHGELFRLVILKESFHRSNSEEGRLKNLVIIAGIDERLRFTQHDRYERPLGFAASPSLIKEGDDRGSSIALYLAEC
jgi:hypothetical protein